MAETAKWTSKVVVEDLRVKTLLPHREKPGQTDRQGTPRTLFLMHESTLRQLLTKAIVCTHPSIATQCLTVVYHLFVSFEHKPLCEPTYL